MLHAIKCCLSFTYIHTTGMQHHTSETWYNVCTLGVECQMHELQNATISVSTSIGKFMYALKCIHVQEYILCFWGANCFQK